LLVKDFLHLALELNNKEALTCALFAVGCSEILKMTPDEIDNNFTVDEISDIYNNIYACLNDECPKDMVQDLLNKGTIDND